MRRFVLHRKEDVSGVSGIGDVAEGVQLQDGQCVLSWIGRLHNIEISPDLSTLIEIHGHGGKTIIAWLDPEVN